MPFSHVDGVRQGEFSSCKKTKLKLRFIKAIAIYTGMFDWLIVFCLVMYRHYFSYWMASRQEWWKGGNIEITGFTQCSRIIFFFKMNQKKCDTEKIIFLHFKTISWLFSVINSVCRQNGIRTSHLRLLTFTNCFFFLYVLLPLIGVFFNVS